MMTLPLAYMASGERMPDREWVRLKRRVENPGIRKEEEELRLDVWMQIEELRLDSWMKIRSTGWDERK